MFCLFNTKKYFLKIWLFVTSQRQKPEVGRKGRKLYPERGIYPCFSNSYWIHISFNLRYRYKTLHQDRYYKDTSFTYILKNLFTLSWPFTREISLFWEYFRPFFPTHRWTSQIKKLKKNFFGWTRKTSSFQIIYRYMGIWWI